MTFGSLSLLVLIRLLHIVSIEDRPDSLGILSLNKAFVADGT